MSMQVDSQGPSSEATKLEIPRTEPGAQQDLLNLYCSSLYRKCSNCGRTGHNSRTCLEARTETIQSSEPGLKSRSEGGLGNNLKDDGDDVEVSEDGGSDHKNKPKEGSRKKGVAWTEEEHKQFLNGLQKLGKGNWRGISRHFVQSKSPTQVASHAQKYFIRQTVAGKRKRRSSLFDLVPENEPTRETDVTSQTTTFPTNAIPGKQEPQSERPNVAEPNMPPPSLQGPEALAWAYWYQSMLMQSNPMTWLPSMMGSVRPQNSGIKNEDLPQIQGSFPGIPNSVPGIASNPLFPSENSGDANNPAIAAYLAQQSQMAAMLAMNCMPQFSPDYLARYAAGLQIHAQAAQAAQKTQSAISSRQDMDKLEREGSADDNLSTLDATHINSPDVEEPVLKFPRRSENGSRFEVSNASSDTEDFGNGALVRPKASKAKSWVELPSFLQERKDAGSLLNTGSKQSQSTKIGALWLSKQHNLVDGQTHSSQGTPPTNSASNLVENSNSDTPSATMDPNLATSHYKEKSVIAQATPSQVEKGNVRSREVL